jgi:hypothetical protein
LEALYGVRGRYGDFSVNASPESRGQIAVDLAGRDVVEPRHAVPAGGFEQRLRALHVRAEEKPRLDDSEAVVGLGGEVDDRVDAFLGEDPLGWVAVADVADREPDAEPVEVARVAGVGEAVERDHVVVRVVLQPPADEVRADEACRAGDEDAMCSHRARPRLARTKSLTW